MWVIKNRTLTNISVVPKIRGISLFLFICHRSFDHIMKITNHIQERRHASSETHSDMILFLKF